MLMKEAAVGRIPEAMKAWALFGPGDLRQVTKPVPRPGEAEVLVKIEAVAICGTDLDILRHGLPAMVDGKPPFTGQHDIGHEYTGTVAAVGATVDEVRVGDRVVVEVHGFRYTIDHPDEAIAIMTKLHGDLLGAKVIEGQVRNLIPLLNQKPVLGKAAPDAWARSLTILYSSGVIRKRLALGDYYTDAFVGG